MMEADVELNRFLDRKASIFNQALLQLASAHMGKADYNVALSDLAQLLRHTMMLADLHGRKRVLMEADRFKKTAKFDLPSSNPITPGVPFEEAIEDLITREPRLENDYRRVAELYNTEHVFAAARSVDLNVTRRVQKALEDMMREGKGISSTEPIIREIGDWTRSYSETVYRTNANTAYTKGRFEQMLDPDVLEVMPAFELVGLEDQNTRPNHYAAHGLIASVDDPIWRRFKPPLGYQCFLPDTLVSAQAFGASKVLYSGTIVEIHTDLGTTLSVTINHPILSFRGWVRANDLTEGDDLVCHRSQIESLSQGPWDRALSFVGMRRRTVNNQKVPARIEDVFETIRTKRMGLSLTRTPVFPLDFYGDSRWMHGDIDIVRTNRLFQTHSDQNVSKTVEQFGLKFGSGSPDSSHAKGTLLSGDKTACHSSNGGPSLGRLTFNDTAVISPLPTTFPFELLSFGSGAELNAQVTQSAIDGSSIDQQFMGQLLDGNAGKVSFAKIIRIRRYPFTGHVYDLETKGGWIIANGIYTSNCRCGVIAVSIFELEQKGLIRNGKVIRYLPPNFANAHPDPGFKVGAMDY